MEKIIDLFVTIMILVAFFILPLITTLLKKKKGKDQGILKKILTAFEAAVEQESRDSQPGPELDHEPRKKKIVYPKLKSEKEFHHLYETEDQKSLSDLEEQHQAFENQDLMPVDLPVESNIKQSNTQKKLARLDALPALKRAIVYSEILGKPKGLDN